MWKFWTRYRSNPMARKSPKSPKSSKTLPSVTAAPAKPRAQKVPMSYLGFFALGKDLSRIEVLIYKTHDREIRFLSRHAQWWKSFPDWGAAEEAIPGYAELHLKRELLEE